MLTGGAIPPDLVTRLADEASKTARHVLSMVIRAIDYLPPIDPTFHEFLRALITADLDLISDDTYRYRVAFIEAFRRHGIRPLDPEPLSTGGLSVDALRWVPLTWTPSPPASAQSSEPTTPTCARNSNVTLMPASTSAIDVPRPAHPPLPRTARIPTP